MFSFQVYNNIELVCMQLYILKSMGDCTPEGYSIVCDCLFCGGSYIPSSVNLTHE